MMMDMGSGGGFRPYFDPDYDYLAERINPPTVCVDNNACEHCTLVKVDSANRNGVLLEMVQVLTDLDLVVSKSYISSDCGWFMDAFHVTDQMGKKITDPSLIRYLQQSMVPSERRRRVKSREEGEEVRTCLGKVVGPRRLAEEERFTALELIGSDIPGLLSSVAAVLADLVCHVASAEVWSHRSRVAMVVYLTDQVTGAPIDEKDRLTHIQIEVSNVVRACHGSNAGWWVGLIGSVGGWVHPERRLHQLMQADRRTIGSNDDEEEEEMEARTTETQVSIESCREKEYSVVNIVSRDRPKLFFDTVCTLTDMDYVVSHATVRSKDSVALQEYFIRRMDGQALHSEKERIRVEMCLVDAIERRPSNGIGFSISTENRTGLLSDITKVFREHGLSVTRADISTRGESAIGTFFVTDRSGNEVVKSETIESIRGEIGGTMVIEVDSSPHTKEPLVVKKITTTTTINPPPANTCGGCKTEQRSSRSFSFGSLLRYGIEQFSLNFGSLRSKDNGYGLAQSLTHS